MRQPHHLGEYEGARGTGGSRPVAEVPCSPHGSLWSSWGHLHPRLGSLPSAPPVALDLESATCGSRSRCAYVSVCLSLWGRGGGVKGALRGGTEEDRHTPLTVLLANSCGWSQLPTHPHRPIFYTCPPPKRWTCWATVFCLPSAKQPSHWDLYAFGSEDLSKTSLRLQPPCSAWTQVAKRWL